MAPRRALVGGRIQCRESGVTHDAVSEEFNRGKSPSLTMIAMSFTAAGTSTSISRGLHLLSCDTYRGLVGPGYTIQYLLEN